MSCKPKKKELPNAEEKGSDTTTAPNDRSSTSDTVLETKAQANKSTPEQRTLPADAADNPFLRAKKKPRRAGFRGKFLQQLRVLLDRESQIDSNIVQWESDGKSFIIMDKSQFESDTIPTYFDNPIAFSSFLNKLSRWGFKRVSSKQTGHFEFSSPTFRRLSASSAPAVATTDTSNSNNDGEDASMQQQQQQQQQQHQQQEVQASPLEAMAQNNQPLQPSQIAAIIDLISSIQPMGQQLNIPSQQPILNQNTSKLNSDVASTILQSIMGTPQQPFQSQQTVNPFINYGGGQTPLSQLQGYPQGNASNALMSLGGMSSQQSAYPNSSPTASVDNNMIIQSLLTLLRRVGEEERQRRAQADAVQKAIIANIIQIIGLTNSIAETERRRGEDHGGISPGTTTHVPHNIAFHPQQVGRPPSAAVKPSSQASGSGRIAALAQTILNDTAGQLEGEGSRENSNSNGNGNVYELA